MKKPILNQGTIEYEIAKNNNIKPRLLLHACCGPCSTSVLEYLIPYFDITVFFYNPNILPKEEYEKRLEALKIVLTHFENVKLIVPDYNQDEYIPFIKGMESLPEGGNRCAICFSIRLEATAKYLSEHKNDFDFYTTTLTVSPHKNAELINEIGNSLATKYDVKYLDSNFKKRDGFLRSTTLSKEFGIYRQDYCGCGYGE